jgi:hypothetical protein
VIMPAIMPVTATQDYLTWPRWAADIGSFVFVYVAKASKKGTILPMISRVLLL